MNKKAAQSNLETLPVQVNSNEATVSAGAEKETFFHLVAASARNVLLAADFTNWDKAPIKMVRAVGGIWNIKVLLAPGRYHYRFLVDPGQPGTNRKYSLPFGTLSGVVEVQ